MHGTLAKTGMLEVAHEIYLASQSEDVGRTAWLFALEEIAVVVADSCAGQKGFDREKFIDACGLKERNL